MNCEECVGLFYEYLNNRLRKDAFLDFLEHIDDCPDCAQEFEIYKQCFKEDFLEQDFPFPEDLNARINYAVQNAREMDEKSKKVIWKEFFENKNLLSRKVLAYAASFAFLFITAVFGGSYLKNIKNLKNAGQPQNPPQISTSDGFSEKTVTPDARNMLYDSAGITENGVSNDDLSFDYGGDAKTEENSPAPSPSVTPSPSITPMPAVTAAPLPTSADVETFSTPVINSPSPEPTQSPEKTSQEETGGNVNDIVYTDAAPPDAESKRMTVTSDSSGGYGDANSGGGGGVTAEGIVPSSAAPYETAANYDAVVSASQKNAVLNKYLSVPLGDNVYELNTGLSTLLDDFDNVSVINSNTSGKTKVKFE
jgi:hypothetical protein